MAPENLRDLIQPGSKENVTPPAEEGFDLFENKSPIPESDGEDWKRGGNEKTTTTEVKPKAIKERSGAEEEVDESVEAGECLWCLQPKSNHSLQCLTHLEGDPRDEARNIWKIGRRNAGKEGFTEPQIKNSDQYMFGWRRGLKDKKNQEQKEVANEERGVASEGSKEETKMLVAEIAGIFQSIKVGDNKKERFIQRYKEMISGLSGAVGPRGVISREVINERLKDFLVELKRAYNIG